jgi:hypothetical protein
LSLTPLTPTFHNHLHQLYEEACRRYLVLERRVDRGAGSWELPLRQDHEEMAAVVALWRGAGEQGKAEALNNLGLLHERGRGVPQSDAEAARLYGQAADLGLAGAQYNLGFLFDQGRGVARQSNHDAARLYRLAADQGFAPAQANLGHFFEHGFGVPRNLVEAARLYGLAADQGLAEARYSLGKLCGHGQPFLEGGGGEGSGGGGDGGPMGSDEVAPEQSPPPTPTAAAAAATAAAAAAAATTPRASEVAASPSRLQRGGAGPRADPDAVAFFEAGVAIGDPEAMERLGRLLADGRGLPKDPSRAAALLAQAALLRLESSNI